MRMRGHARDLYTPPGAGAARVTDESRIDARVSPAREILSIAASPPLAGIEGLVGTRGGGHLRAAISQVLPEQRASGSALHLLLDDLAGASLVAGWAWSRWIDDWATVVRSSGAKSAAGRNGRMEGICAGFRPGSSALQADGSVNISIQSCAPVPPLSDPQDPLGWHALPEQHGVGMRRARRLDVRLDGVLRIDVGFQDSATSPQGGRLAVHEYHVSATADAASLRLLSVTADPRVLPYGECPSASGNVGRMIGQPLADFRSAVPDMLPGTLGCTHLNDVLRSLADVPRLLEVLRYATPG